MTGGVDVGCEDPVEVDDVEEACEVGGDWDDGRSDVGKG